MRKLIFAISIFTSLLLLGCNNKSYSDNQYLEMASSELISTLEDFNSEMLASMPSTRAGVSWLETAWFDIRGTKDGAKHGGNIGRFFGVKGRIVGMVVGGLITGSAASYAFATVGDECMPEPDVYTGALVHNVYDDPMIVYEASNEVTDEQIEDIKDKSQVNIELPERYEYLYDVGIMHNAVLANLNNQDSDSQEISGGQQAIATQTRSASSEYIDNDITLQILASEEFQEGYQAILYGMFEEVIEVGNLDIEQTIDHYVETEEDALLGMIMELFKEVYLLYPEKVADVDFVINYYIKAIEASNEISEEDKEAIYTGFVVAAYSPRYWLDHIQ